MDNFNLYSDSINVSGPVQTFYDYRTDENNKNRVVFDYNYKKGAKTNKELNASSKVELKLSCTDLPNFDNISKTDAKIFIFYEEKTFENNKTTTKWVKIGSTEIVKNDLNPHFNKTFVLDYYFQYIQNLRFIIMDVDDDNENIEENDFIGYVEETISGIIASSKEHCASFEIKREDPSNMNLKKKKSITFKNPKLNITVEVIKDYNLFAFMEVSGLNFDKKDVVGKSDPFFVISKRGLDESWIKVYESPIIKNTLNPEWPKFDISLTELTSNDDKRMLKWDVYDWDKDSTNDYIGGFEASIEIIKNQNKFELINPSKKEKKSKDYTNSGTFVFNRVEIRPGHSFSSFAMGGTELSVNFAIDFTESNGEQTNDKSLHYINPKYDPLDFYSMNDYQKAISAIGYVLEPYDTNKYLGVYGYGGIFGDDKKASYAYPLTKDPKNPYVYGTRGVLNAYTEILKNVKLSGPTNFTPMIKKIMEESDDCISHNTINGHRTLKKYNILVFLTNGLISDLKETINQLKTASTHPLSIVIIGVGSADFKNMLKLDGDDTETKFRDIVQFVPLNEFIDNPAKIACETLAEIPNQLLSYARLNDLFPPNIPPQQPKKN